MPRAEEIDVAGYCSPEAPIYPQGSVHWWRHDATFVIAAGGGGGAAQMMPATILDACIAEAHRRSVGMRSAPERLLALCETLDEQLGRVIDNPDRIYLGSSAQAVVCVGDERELWFANIGLGRAYRIGAGAAIQLTRDDSLLQNYIETGATAEQIAQFPHRHLATAVLNGSWRATRRAWHPVACALDGGLGFLLATEPVHEAAPPALLAERTREALRAPDLAAAARALWSELRDHVERHAPSGPYDRPPPLALADFDRRAALLLLLA